MTAWQRFVRLLENGSGVTAAIATLTHERGLADAINVDDEARRVILHAQREGAGDVPAPRERGSATGAWWPGRRGG